MPRSIPIAMSLLLLAVAAPAAWADDDETEDDAEGAQKERLIALHAARNESLRMFHENRSAAIAEYKAAFNATKASFLENKTRVLASCGALNETDDDNESDDGNVTGGCVRDGLKPLIQKARDQHREQKKLALERLLAAREAAKEAFRAARDAYGPHGSG